MGEPFSAFTFVDRITQLEPGKRARGLFTVPERLADFRSSLVAEAVGQLAAWVSMAYLDFRLRPVAGLAGRASFLGDVRPGELLELEVELESCDDSAVAYGGIARVNGVPVLELAQCLGPMLPLPEFDAPDAVRGRFEVLCGAGAPVGRFPGVADPATEIVERSPSTLRATLRVPQNAPFFGDHFPRRAVFPGTLLLDAQIRLALELARAAAKADGQLVPASVSNVKIRSFILPGQDVELRTELTSGADELMTVALAARVDGKPVATGRMAIAMREAA
jgi:3-hydroxymyristoyl/3-hydroxydecanoyl-(acyl carrier protein) dehydratase